MSFKYHFSWDSNEIDIDTFFDKLDSYQERYKKSNLCNYQNNIIPVYKIDTFDILLDKKIQKDIYEQFHNGAGALIIKNVFDIKIMEEYNNWCEDILEEAKNDKNCKHPKQKNKYLINDVIKRMTDTKPDLLMKLIANNYINKFTDILLGFTKYGSCTTHWIEPGADRQLSHVDYPMHVGSGVFWNNDINKVLNTTTKYQINNILPYYSVQVLIASDAMDIKNGSTEIVPCSHLLTNLDILIHDKEYYKQFEKYFINVSLDQGDVLLFNRGLCHRGGKNISSNRRNSLIIQSIWLWGIGQEIINSSIIIDRLVKTSNQYQQLEDTEKEKFQLRIDFPYPKDVSKST